jgi:hypothetical protein
VSRRVDASNVTAGASGCNILIRITMPPIIATNYPINAFFHNIPGFRTIDAKNGLSGKIISG